MERQCRIKVAPSTQQSSLRARMTSACNSLQPFSLRPGVHLRGAAFGAVAVAHSDAPLCHSQWPASTHRKAEIRRRPCRYGELWACDALCQSGYQSAGLRAMSTHCWVVRRTMCSVSMLCHQVLAHLQSQYFLPFTAGVMYAAKLYTPVSIQADVYRQHRPEG